MTPGRLMIGVDGAVKVGNGHGQDGVAVAGNDGTTVGVAVFEDGFGGVFRVTGGVLDSCTIVVFGTWLALLLGVVVGRELGPPGSLGSVPGLTEGRFALFGSSHFGQATVVCWANCSIVASASTADFSDSGGNFGANSPRAWRALVMKVVIAVIELMSPSCWYDATNRDTPLRA